MKNSTETHILNLFSFYIVYIDMSCVIWTAIYMITFETTKILQRKWDIDTKTKAIERESKNIMWV